MLLLLLAILLSVVVIAAVAAGDSSTVERSRVEANEEAAMRELVCLTWKGANADVEAERSMTARLNRRPIIVIQLVFELIKPMLCGS